MQINKTQENSTKPNILLVEIGDISAPSLNIIASTLYNEKLYESAIHVFKQSAEKGDEDAYLQLGDMFMEGKGAEKSYIKAELWYKKALKKGNMSAKLCLAKLYESEIGLDYDEARRWYLDAADGGCGEAALRLGEIYEYGVGMRKDLLKACRWYEEAARLESSEGAFRAGRMYHKSYHNYKEACKFYKQATYGGPQGDALNNLGIIYYHGLGVDQNYKKAFDSFSLSAGRKCHEAYFNLGLLYQSGTGVTKDLNLALWHFEEALKGGVEGCERNIAIIQNMKEDPKEW